jgi:primase-polymerase (primpol)-like protein
MTDAPGITLASLAGHPIWVGWKKETRGGKATKLPYDPKTGRKAKADNPSTWATRDEAGQ